MLVAEKQQYLESYDTYAHESVRVVEEPKTSSKAKAKEKRKNKIMPIVTVLIGFGLCSMIVARYTMIAQNHSNILHLKQELEKELKKEERLKLELNSCGDLKRIEEYAKNHLNMGYPDESQVLYVELPQLEHYEAIKNPEEQIGIAYRDEEATEKTLWDRIVSLLD